MLMSTRFEKTDFIVRSLDMDFPYRSRIDLGHLTPYRLFKLFLLWTNRLLHGFFDILFQLPKSAVVVPLDFLCIILNLITASSLLLTTMLRELLALPFQVIYSILDGLAFLGFFGTVVVVGVVGFVGRVLAHVVWLDWLVMEAEEEEVRALMEIRSHWGEEGIQTDITSHFAPSLFIRITNARSGRYSVADRLLSDTPIAHAYTLLTGTAFSCKPPLFLLRSRYNKLRSHLTRTWAKHYILILQTDSETILMTSPSSSHRSVQPVSLRPSRSSPPSPATQLASHLLFAASLAATAAKNTASVAKSTYDVTQQYRAGEVNARALLTNAKKEKATQEGDRADVEFGGRRVWCTWRDGRVSAWEWDGLEAGQMREVMGMELAKGAGTRLARVVPMDPPLTLLVGPAGVSFKLFGRSKPTVLPLPDHINATDIIDIQTSRSYIALLTHSHAYILASSEPTTVLRTFSIAQNALSRPIFSLRGRWAVFAHSSPINGFAPQPVSSARPTTPESLVGMLSRATALIPTSEPTAPRYFSIYDLVSGKHMATYSVPAPNGIAHVSLSPSGTRLLVVPPGARTVDVLELLDPRSAVRISRLTRGLRAAEVEGVVWSLNGGRVGVRIVGVGNVSVFDVEGGGDVKVSARVCALPGSRGVLTVSEEGGGLVLKLGKVVVKDGQERSVVGMSEWKLPPATSCAAPLQEEKTVPPQKGLSLILAHAEIDTSRGWKSIWTDPSTSLYRLPSANPWPSLFGLPESRGELIDLGLARGQVEFTSPTEEELGLEKALAEDMAMSKFIPGHPAPLPRLGTSPGKRVVKVGQAGAKMLWKGMEGMNINISPRRVSGGVGDEGSGTSVSFEDEGEVEVIERAALGEAEQEELEGCSREGVKHAVYDSSGRESPMPHFGDPDDDGMESVFIGDR
ncbi:hypothetical protein G7K_5742-t3 [Saitoella complicata NRRL Y-17804]|uniref:Uncharacterized protein n=1 Tax=Saitoella complicata (strain BCRC 22490 / CBS 7301 / JCM 7358 / NBRC 10748 / NRRL Y-17804) TaxID=698492 RepID=A0A0E9NP87_SAICN|nr:hypothetical protein G7K_5742-t3 [Saitoella complicata NRRL Y-17804]